MERCYRPSHRRCCEGDSPSFSSSLLDAIYRSIDQTDGGAAAVRDKKHTGGAPDPYPCSGLPSANRKKHSAIATATVTAAAATVTEKSGLRRKHEANDHHHHYHYHYHRRPFLISTTSSSSDGSSNGGFSSSDAESAIASSRLKPVRTVAPPARSEKIRSDLPPPPPSHHQEKKSPGSISIRSRLRDLRKGKPDSAPASPGARLANFINALFSGAGIPRKTKTSSPAIPAAARGGGGGDESACSSASSYTRSCLSKTPSSGGRSGGKRSVRFGPVSVVDADEFRPCGRRSRYDDVDPAVARARESRRMVAELLRGLEAEEYEDDDDGAESDTSSDLFELENLTAIGQGYRDELPVYETTYLATNRAIAQGLIV